MNEQGFPNIGSPVVDPRTGTIQQVWLQLFVSLWNRTGSGQGVVNVPPGAIVAHGSTNPPDGYLLCDGSLVSRSTFSALFQAIGTIWGAGDGSTTFNLPDLRDKFLMGAGGAHSVGDLGGASSFILDIGQLPAHTHTITDPGHSHVFTGTAHTHGITDPGHVHTSLTATATNTAGGAGGTAVAGNTGSATTGVTVNAATGGGSNAPSTTGVSVNATGSGDPVSLIPPFAGVNYVIKT